MKTSPFLKQAELVLRLLPFIYFEKKFAGIKGAVVLFIQ